MTSQTSGNTSWKRAMAVVMATGALAAGLSLGIAAPVAWADPTTPTTDPDAPPPMTADQVLAIIDADYDTGAGGGQISNLIHTVMKLRAQGFMPSNANKEAIVAALDKRPNQQPLIEALQATLVTQRRNQASAQAAQQPPTSTTVGVGQMPGQDYDPNGNRNQEGGGIQITAPSG